MLFKKSLGELVQQSLGYLVSNTSITNTNIGGITRSIIEVINKNISDYYDILDINMAMSFLSTSEGYYLDLIGTLFNMPRIGAVAASAAVSDGTQKFYVVTGTLYSRLPTGQIPSGTIVSNSDGSIVYKVTQNTSFSVAATEVFVPILSDSIGAKYNVPPNLLIYTSLGIDGIFTTNSRAIVSGSDTESDANYKYRLMNATLSAEKANEIAVRLAALSVTGVADVVIKPYARGIGTYDIIVIPIEGIATSTLISRVQSAIESVQAYGIRGTAIAPTIVPVDIEVRLIFTKEATDYQQNTIKSVVQSAIEKYIVSIPIGGTFILNELRQQIMDVSNMISDHVINCYYFREQPTFHGNVDIYWDEVFYPNPNSTQAIRVL